MNKIRVLKILWGCVKSLKAFFGGAEGSGSLFTQPNTSLKNL
jgi:hypothetical protein